MTAAVFIIGAVAALGCVFYIAIGQFLMKRDQRKAKPMPPIGHLLPDYGPPLNVYERYRMGQAEWAWEQDTVPHPVEQP